MKFSLILISALLFAPSVNAMPFGRSGGSFEQCNRYKYNERYVPGYYNKHGQYVGGYVKTTKVNLPCISDTFRANKIIIVRTPIPLSRIKCMTIITTITHI